MEFLITGCGRSGTKYVAERINSSGILCGHEKIFTVNGPSDNNFKHYRGDSSWFAVPFLEILNRTQPVLHIVRNPVKVVKSFYRIGLCSRSLIRQFSRGENILEILLRYNIKIKKIKNRYDYVKAHRNLLLTYTSCWEKNNEIDRLWEYWYQWNRLVELKVAQYNLNYLRVNLESVDQFWPEISEFLKIKTKPNPGVPINTKPKFKRQFSHFPPPSQEVIDLAYKYGYRSIIKEIYSESKKL